MKKNNKTTPFLMILVLSIVATQLSLKAVGINITPSIGTVVQSWGKMAALIGGIYQPGFVAELDTLSNHILCDEDKAAAEAEKPCGEIACNRVKDFDFELPPPIDVNDPSVTIHEPIQEASPKPMSRIISNQEDKKADASSTEIVEGEVADADEEGDGLRPAAETRQEPVRPAVGIILEAPEPEGKPATGPSESRVSIYSDEIQTAPKDEKAKKPCADVEKYKKLEEIKELEEKFQLKPDGQYIEQTAPIFEVQIFQAAQTFQANQSFEKVKRATVRMKRVPIMLPMVLPLTVKTEDGNSVSTAE